MGTDGSELRAMIDGTARLQPSPERRRASPDRLLWARGRAMLEDDGRRHTPRGPRRCFEAAHAALYGLASLGLKASGLHRRGRRNALDVRLVRLDLTFPDLPRRFDGYRLLHLTDPHFDMMDGLDAAVCRAVAGVSADLLVMTGDYRAAHAGPFDRILPPLARVVACVGAADGVLATLGNHDDHHMVDAFEDLGIRVLVNETRTIRRGGHRLCVTGLDDVNRYYTPAADQALAAAGPLGPGDFGLALVHSAEMAAEAAAAGFSLYLCGHTHGGQICLPGGRPILTHMSRNRGLSAGLWSCGAMKGYTSPGAGVSGVPARFFSRGEVTLITLRRRARSDSLAALKR